MSRRCLICSNINPCSAHGEEAQQQELQRNMIEVQQITGRKTFITEPNPWHPMNEPIDLKHLGKFAEELNECGSAVARCIIQGIDECEPSTGECNRDWLIKEIADVICNAELVVEHFGLDWSVIRDRIQLKREHLRKWHRHA